MIATRRQLLTGAAAVVIAAAGAGYYVFKPAGSILPARAEDSPSPTRVADGPAVGNDELMKPNPLGEMVLGDPTAPVTIIEYASMTCPHCAHFSTTTFPELKKRYIDTGKVRFIFREFPLDQLAAAGFILARCAGPDKYFPKIETLFAPQRDWAAQRPLAPLGPLPSRPA